jgi:undecaprenyl diphosphate synthase
MTAGLHVAIIMDGNGRWATARGLPRLAGHRVGMEAVRRVVETAPSEGISILTLYAFSADNWRRPMREVSTLMRLLRLYLAQETSRCIAKGVRLEVIGRRDRLPATVVGMIEDTERKTAKGTRLRLRLAIDYSARHAIMEAAAKSPGADAEEWSKNLGPDVDLLIRTSGEQRLSDFLLWESAYAEIIFTPRMWPEFGAEDLASAMTEFHRRERRFGAIVAAPSRRTA